MSALRPSIATLLATSVAFVSAACLGGSSVGPPPQPVDDEQTMESGEETARQAGEAARERRDDDETVLYATSRRSTAHTEADDDPPDNADDALTLYFDTDGRLLDADGSDVDIDALHQLSDDPLAGRAIRLVIASDADERTIGELTPLFDAVDDRGAVLHITTGETPDDDETPDEKETSEGETPDDQRDDAP